MGSIGFRQVKQAQDVEYNHEQDAEQDRNQQDRGRKPFHVPNVTPSTADWVMPILLAVDGYSGHPGGTVVIARAGLIRNPFAWIRRTAGD
jgi:3-oxoacyl-(acyl-carrier-protein) synthase